MPEKGRNAMDPLSAAWHEYLNVDEKAFGQIQSGEMPEGH